jgi:hypothetical protein
MVDTETSDMDDQQASRLMASSLPEIVRSQHEISGDVSFR